MDPMTIAAVGAPIAGGILGNILSSGDRDRARQSNEAALAAILALNPQDRSAPLLLEKYKSLGTITPEMEQAIQAKETEFKSIQEDPSLRNAQMNALSSLSQRARTGLNAEDRLALNDVRQQTQRDVEAKRQQIMQNFQARGQGGSTNELVAALSAGQDATQRSSDEGDRIAAQASRNALEAALQSGNLGGSIRAQDFNVESTKANAADQLNRFNTELRAGEQQRNVAAKNQAAYYGKQQDQAAANSNTGQTNQELYDQIRRGDNYYNQQYQKAGASSNAYGNQANTYNQQAQQTQQGIANIGSGVGAGAGALASKKTKNPWEV